MRGTPTYTRAMDTPRAAPCGGWLRAAAIFSAFLAVAPATAADAPSARGDGAANAPKPTTMVVPLFSQVVIFNVPSGWQRGNERSTERSYLLEIVPGDQTVLDWKEMISLSAYRAIGENPEATPANFLNGAAGKMREHCAGEAITTALGALKVDGYPAYAAILGCPEVRGARRGEVGLHVAMMVGKDLITFQRALRGRPFTAATSPISPATARGAYGEFGPIKVCDKVPDMGPCLARAQRQ